VARTMIMWIPQQISCLIHMKSEITVDHAAPGARAPRPNPGIALAGTTRADLGRRRHQPLTAAPRPVYVNTWKPDYLVSR
jgi:hypothetical protein